MAETSRDAETEANGVSTKLLISNQESNKSKGHLTGDVLQCDEV